MINKETAMYYTAAYARNAGVLSGMIIQNGKLEAGCKPVAFGTWGSIPSMPHNMEMYPSGEGS